MQPKHEMKRTRRPHTDGFTHPYRPAPADFRDVFLRIGWDGIEEHFRTNSRCIARWIEECGGDELRDERARVTGRKGFPKRRSTLARRYVLGQRLKRMATPSFFDADLMEDEK